MIRKLYIIFLIIMIAVIAIVSIELGNIYNTYSAYRGEVQGTGFIYKEMPGAGSASYDVDSQGKIYFAINNQSFQSIAIYGSGGDYLYTLRIDPGAGTHFVKIDDQDNIMVYEGKQDVVNVYNQSGILIKTINAPGNNMTTDFLNSDIPKREKPNGIVYENVDGRITKTENGVTTTVFTVPEWQREASLYNVLLVILILALAVLIGIQIAKWRTKANVEQHRSFPHK